MPNSDKTTPTERARLIHLRDRGIKIAQAEGLLVEEYPVWYQRAWGWFTGTPPEKQWVLDGKIIADPKHEEHLELFSELAREWKNGRPKQGAKTEFLSVMQGARGQHQHDEERAHIDWAAVLRPAAQLGERVPALAGAVSGLIEPATPSQEIASANAGRISKDACPIPSPWENFLPTSLNTASSPLSKTPPERACAFLVGRPNFDRCTPDLTNDGRPFEEMLNRVASRLTKAGCQVYRVSIPWSLATVYLRNVVASTQDRLLIGSSTHTTTYRAYKSQGLLEAGDAVLDHFRRQMHPEDQEIAVGDFNGGDVLYVPSINDRQAILVVGNDFSGQRSNVPPHKDAQLLLEAYGNPHTLRVTRHSSRECYDLDVLLAMGRNQQGELVAIVNLGCIPYSPPKQVVRAGFLGRDLFISELKKLGAHIVEVTDPTDIKNLVTNGLFLPGGKYIATGPMTPDLQQKLKTIGVQVQIPRKPFLMPDQEGKPHAGLHCLTAEILGNGRNGPGNILGRELGR